MPWFDLKQADIRFRDGFGNNTADKVGAVNLMAGYSAGATTMLVDAIVGIIPTGVVFTIAGDTSGTKYRVTAHSETLGNTTSVTFTPGLAEAVLDNAVITFESRVLEVKIGEGNLTFNEKQTIEYKRNRGRLDQTRYGDDEPIDVSFDFWYEFLTASTGLTPSIEDVLKNRGEASDWITSDQDDPCQPFSIDIEVFYTPLCTGEDIELVTLPKFRWETLNHDLKAGTISCSGKCNVTQAVIERIAQS